jgi:hypothetical protein
MQPHTSSHEYQALHIFGQVLQQTLVLFLLVIPLAQAAQI